MRVESCRLALHGVLQGSVTRHAWAVCRGSFSSLRVSATASDLADFLRCATMATGSDLAGCLLRGNTSCAALLHCCIATLLHTATAAAGRWSVHWRSTHSRNICSAHSMPPQWRCTLLHCCCYTATLIPLDAIDFQHTEHILSTHASYCQHTTHAQHATWAHHTHMPTLEYALPA